MDMGTKWHTRPANTTGRYKLGRTLDHSEQAPHASGNKQPADRVARQRVVRSTIEAEHAGTRHAELSCGERPERRAARQ